MIVFHWPECLARFQVCGLASLRLSVRIGDMLRDYLRLTSLKLGLVINSGERLVKNGIHRVVNGLVEDPEGNASAMLVSRALGRDFLFLCCLSGMMKKRSSPPAVTRQKNW